MLYLILVCHIPKWLHMHMIGIKEKHREYKIWRNSRTEVSHFGEDLERYSSRIKRDLRTHVIVMIIVCLITVGTGYLAYLWIKIIVWFIHY